MIELTKLELDNQTISLDVAIKRLTALKFTWRGDKLEYDLLMLLASYYKKAGDNINALRTYKYIESAFNNTVSNFYITSEMVRIFNKLFLSPEFETQVDDFNAVALFYEFKELTPIGPQGDEVIIGIAKRLMRLDLLEEAAKLLNHQVKYRLSGEKRVITADQLAIILLINKKPLEAIEILDSTELENFKFHEHQYRLRLRARALIDLKKYDQALEHLKDDFSDDAEILKREAVFRAEKWNDYIQIVSTKLPQDIQVEMNPQLVQDILRLAIAYYKQNDQVELQNLSKIVGGKNEYLKNTIDLLLTTNTPVDYKNLDKTLNINQMQTLLNKYKQYMFHDQPQ